MLQRRPAAGSVAQAESESDESLFLLAAHDFASHLRNDARKLESFRATFRSLVDLSPVYATLTNVLSEVFS